MNGVTPDLIETEMIEGVPRDEIEKLIPMRWIGRPDEVAAVVSFLNRYPVPKMAGSGAPPGGSGPMRNVSLRCSTGRGRQPNQRFGCRSISPDYRAILSHDVQKVPCGVVDHGNFGNPPVGFCSPDARITPGEQA